MFAVLDTLKVGLSQKQAQQVEKLLKGEENILDVSVVELPFYHINNTPLFDQFQSTAEAYRVALPGPSAAADTWSYADLMRTWTVRGYVPALRPVEDLAQEDPGAAQSPYLQTRVLPQSFKGRLVNSPLLLAATLLVPDLGRSELDLLYAHYPHGGEDREAMCDWLAERAGGIVEIRVPARGDKVKLLAMAANNARLLLAERRLRRENRKKQVPHAVSSLQRDLGLRKAPRRIEAIDISNTQGSDPVASLVCFVDGKPKKGDYRRYRITGIPGPDDFAMMRYVVTRRLKRLMEEGADFPDLLLVDGGKGQLSSAMEAMSGLGISDVPAAGLAKRLEEVFVPGSPDPQNIPKTSSSLRLLQAVRDEAHRFALSYHKTLRRKRMTLSSLDRIGNIGPGRRRSLIRRFGSVRRLAEAEVSEIASVEGIGLRLAERVKACLGQVGECPGPESVSQPTEGPG